MNAVKRCLALIAATLVVNACGGDPTAERAGADLSIRATPGAVWVRNNSSATVNIEAVDPLGGPAAGSWTVGAIAGPMTVALDTNYQNTSTGQLGVKSRFVVTPTAEGEGSVEFSGTGGNITVPVRIAPDTNDYNVVFTSPTEVAGNVTVPLNSPVTLTSPTGIRFTATTTVRIATGPLARDTAMFRPIAFSITPDSQSLTFTPGPNSSGQVRITGLASPSTPSLTSNARTGARLITDQFDTAGSTRLALSTTTPALGAAITVTLPPEYRFSPNTAVNHFTDSTQKSGAVLQVATDGLGQAVVSSVSADSGTLIYTPAPGARGKPRFSNLRVRGNAAAWAFSARASGSYTVANLPACATGSYSTTGQPASTGVTITAPTYKFRPSSVPSSTGGVFTTWPIVSVAADSSTITVLPPPGVTKPATISNMVWTPVAALSLNRTICDSVSATAPVDMGADDPAGSPVIALPAMAVGAQRGIYDLMSMSQPDITFDGGSAMQWYTVTVTTTGTYRVTAQWNSGSDVDMGIMVKDGSYGTSGDFLDRSATNNALSGAKPETQTVLLTAGTTYVVAVIDWEGDSSPTGILQLLIQRTQ